MKATRSSRTPRLYYDGKLQIHSELELSKRASHHLVTVVRTKLNADIQLFNGDGFHYAARLIETGQQVAGKRARLEIYDRKAAVNESPIRVSLLQAISRGDKMDHSLRQSVELGVTHIQPLYSRHSVKTLDTKRTEKKMEHWLNIITSACEQSGRAYVPSLAMPATLNEWLDNDDKTALNLVLSPTASTSLPECIQNQRSTVPALGVMIGPESGFDDDEIQQAVDAGFNAVRFGQRILRTETAGPACIAVVQTLLGDIGRK